jgi:hypothetical protein
MINFDLMAGFFNPRIPSATDPSGLPSNFPWNCDAYQAIVDENLFATKAASS